MLTMLLQAILEPCMEVPSSITARVIAMIQGSVGNREFARALDNNAGHSLARRALMPRLGLLKAWLIRSGDSQLRDALEPNHDQPGYQAGRLAALLEIVRANSQTRPVSLVAHRNLAHLIADPTALLEQRTLTVQRDLRRIAARRPWLAISLEGRLEQVWQMLQGTIPAHRDARDRALFILAYYQQIVFDNIQRDAARPREDSPAVLSDDELEAIGEVGQRFYDSDTGTAHSVE